MKIHQKSINGYEKRTPAFPGQGSFRKRSCLFSANYSLLTLLNSIFYCIAYYKSLDFTNLQRRDNRVSG